MYASLLLLFAGCRPAAPLLDQYLTASCRLLTEETCLDSQDGSCSYTLAYADVEGCIRDQHRQMGRQCVQDAEAALLGLEPGGLELCLDELDDLSCSDEDVCDPSPAFVTGACAPIYAAVETACGDAR